MSPCCKAVKDDSRKHTVNLFLIAISEDCRTNSGQGASERLQEFLNGVVWKLSSFR